MSTFDVFFPSLHFNSTSLYTSNKQIDRVPAASLERLSKISNSIIWDSSTDLLNCNEKKLPSWGIFTELERVTFGKKSDTYYRIQNVKKLKSIQKSLVSFHDLKHSDSSSGRSMTDIPPEKIPAKEIPLKNIPPKKDLQDSSQQFPKIDESLEVENKLLGLLATNNHKDEKVIVGTEERGRNGEQGEIEEFKVEDAESVEHRMTCQLVLQSNSIISSNIYCRLIRRCLTAAIRIDDDAMRSNSKRHTTSTPPTSSPSFSSFPPTSTASFPQSSSISTSFPSTSTSTSKLNTAYERKRNEINESTSVWVPGGGAAEMGWSALWGSVSSILTNHMNSQCNMNSNNTNEYNDFDNNKWNHSENNVSNNSDNFLLESQRKCNIIFEVDQLCNKSYQTIIRPIAVKIAHRIISNILNSHGFKDKYEKQILNKKENIIYFKSVRTCVQICTLFSDAYVQVPRTMLYNAQKSHQNGPNVISKKSENIWRLWRSHYELEVRVEELKIYTGGTGRLGLIVPFRKVMNHLRKDDDYLS